MARLAHILPASFPMEFATRFVYRRLNAFTTFCMCQKRHAQKLLYSVTCKCQNRNVIIRFDCISAFPGAVYKKTKNRRGCNIFE